MPLPSFVDDLGDGIYAVDTGFERPRFAAAYLMVERGRGAFIDTGTRYAVPRLLQALDALGLGPADVDWVIPTHVHLDHAGGAGTLMRSLPHARMAVHPRGARHMIDPTALYAGALAVYGKEEMDRAYGRLDPVPAERVLATHDGQQLDLAGRPLHIIDLPGHARHHHGIWDARSRCWFTGDTFGLGYGELVTARGPFLLVSSTPSQFEPEVLKASIARMLQWQPAGMCLTHYGRVGDAASLPALAQGLAAQIDALVALGRAEQAAGTLSEARLRDGLATLYRSWLRDHGVADVEVALGLLALDIRLNAQGLAGWLQRPPVQQA